MTAFSAAYASKLPPAPHTHQPGDIQGLPLIPALGGTGAATLTGMVKGNGTAAMTAGTAAVDYVAPGTATTFTAKQTFSGTSSSFAVFAPNYQDDWTLSATAATGTINYDIFVQDGLFYATAATGNWILNFRMSASTTLDAAMGSETATTVRFLVQQGATPFINTSVTIGASTVTLKWVNSAPTAGTANGIDLYTYTIFKTAAGAFTVFARMDTDTTLAASVANKVNRSGDTMSGDLHLNYAQPAIGMSKAASGSQCFIRTFTNNSVRWDVVMGDTTAESGSNAGSDFQIQRYNDAGGYLGNPMLISRATGAATMSTSLAVGGAIPSPSLQTGSVIAYTNQTVGNAVLFNNYYDGAFKNLTAGYSGSLSVNSSGVLQLWLGSNVAAGVAGAVSNFLNIDQAGSASFMSTTGTLRAYGGRIISTMAGQASLSVYNTNANYACGIYASDNHQLVFSALDGGGGIGTVYGFFDNSGNFTIQGSVATKASGTTWANPSDARIKEDVAPYDAGLKEICALEPVTFRFKPSTEYASAVLGTRHISLIAQDAEKVMPEMVMAAPQKVGEHDYEDFRTMDTSAITFALINSVKTLSAKLDDALARIEALEAAR